MSKIQEALAKIQRERGRPPPLQNEATEPFGALSDRPAPAPGGRHRYRGPLVDIDLDEIRAAGLIGPENKERELLDEYRRIKRPILRNLRAEGDMRVPCANVVLICSAEAGEGKTFTCINLSFSIALERDHEVLLIDADILKPQISHLFGLGNRPGLTDLLGDESVAVEDVISPTDVDGLAVLPAGAPHTHGTELLSSSRMKRFVQDYLAADPHRVVLIDSSPLLLTTEALAMTSFVGQIVMVVKAGVTEQGKVAEAVEKLDDKKPVNLILNQATGGLLGGHYGYDYGYGYGKDYRYQET